MKELWHALKRDDVLQKLQTQESGLLEEDALLRLQQEGLNTLKEERPEGIGKIFLQQFQSPLIYVLLAAAGIVLALGDFIDGIIIIAVLLFNALLGAFQELKAQNTLLALKKFVETTATVLRDGKERVISDIDLVRGDMILLQEGERVPADARLLISQNLRVDESSFTGESTPVQKAEELSEEELERASALLVQERRTMVFKGTTIVAGTGKAVVVATGMNTQIGGISAQLSSISTDVPLKANIARLSRVIIAGVFVVALLLFSAGVLLFGKEVSEMFKLVVALAVSFIPEGLPVALTLILVAGVWRMAKRNALVKRLQAVEALGQASVIAVDKTGTITKNELVVRKIFAGDRIIDVTGEGYDVSGLFSWHSKEVLPSTLPELAFACRAAALSAASVIMAYSQKDQRWNMTGDPTEAAIMVLGKKGGYEELRETLPLIWELPFDAKSKTRLVIREEGGDRFAIITGAPERILELSLTEEKSSLLQPISQERREELEAVITDLTSQGLRVVGFATARVNDSRIENNSLPPFTFGGFWAMQDTVRPEAKEALAMARRAGMRVVMITGDHKLTAQAIAREVGIFREGDLVLTGYDIEGMEEEDLLQAVGEASVFARVTPEHKLRIIRTFRRRGEVIAMTGDGINDAPSLVAADLGVAMGRAGTEVAKEAADIILLDDNFGSIVAAAEEGRNIYRTIRKVLQYLLSTNIGEVLAISVALFVFTEHPLPLIAVQILWLNFVTDGFLVAALAMEPKENNLLDRPLASRNVALVDAPLLGTSLFVGIIIAMGSLLVFWQEVSVGSIKAQSMVLATMASFQWFRAWSTHTGDESVFTVNPFSNRFLVGALLLVIALQMIAFYTPLMNTILRTVPLSLADWALVVGISSSVLIAEELRKFIRNRFWVS
ncbi:MAG: HAD-IC family P-type ATPase [bacterium]|nr:HAD-IC family P-type ATPase [bacterium]